MSPKFLITTADERTWRRDRSVLFLGEWCRLYLKRESWKDLDAEVVPYHWDDRQKYYTDYLCLQTIYEDALRATGTALNDIHGTKHSLRYWRLLIGPWLYLFIHVLFDRWTMVNQATLNYEINETILLSFSPDDVIPKNLKGLDPDSLVWNHYLFGQAIRHQKKIPWVEIPTTSTKVEYSNPSIQVTGRNPVSSTFRAWASSLLGLFTKNEEAMIVQSYLPRFAEIKLQLALGQVPKLWKMPDLETFSPDPAQRTRLKIRSRGTDDFSRFLCAMIPEQIPTVYLEGYRNLATVVQNLPWPDRPKVIFTSNLFQNCEVFQAWTAEKVEAGAPFVVGQHGGFYGVGKWHCGEDHQVKIADRFLTWGWSDDRPSLYPGFVLTNVGKPQNAGTPNGSLLMVTTPVRLVGFKSICWPTGANQAEAFLRDQMTFVENLEVSPRKSLILRLHKGSDRKMGSAFFDRLQDTFPDVTMDDSREHIESRIRACRLFVYACNSTGYLETMARDIPTVVFWTPSLFELRSSAEPYFEDLKQVGIYHETPESAAKHINSVWDDIAQWWHRPEVQRARNRFCEEYARAPRNPIQFLKMALKTVPASKARFSLDSISPFED